MAEVLSPFIFFLEFQALPIFFYLVAKAKHVYGVGKDSCNFSGLTK